MAYKMLEGIIKLIPKFSLKQNAIDWQPTMLLNTIYKLILKLLAIHLNNLLHELISKLQAGFVSGRSILEDVSITWLVKDWLTIFLTLFIKLAYEKAFD